MEYAQIKLKWTKTKEQESQERERERKANRKTHFKRRMNKKNLRRFVDDENTHQRYRMNEMQRTR